jgi:uncharacterized protein YabE (DUF348 family)
VGAIQIDETHVKRSSSMSFALRWKHEKLRVVLLAGLAATAAALLFFMLMYGTATKSVSLVVNGEESIVKTKQWDLKHLLDEQAITIGEHDRVSAGLDAKIKNGAVITVDHAKAIQVTADGETKTLHTTGKTVQNALDEFNIKVGPEDRITPSLETGLNDSLSVKVVRVAKKVEQQVVPVAFQTEMKQDAGLLKGKQLTVREGQKGSKVIKKEKVFEDGVLKSEKVLGESVMAASVNKLVAVGMKNPVVVASVAPKKKVTVSKAKAVKISAGAPGDYKEILNNVTLTAYSAGPASTGKSVGDAGYGQTATGTTVTEGRTIAVDPGVIPLGWWVYIEGIGYRRAEDTGGAINGKKIDVYYDSEKYANRFGLKRGYTVYVIGPKKPASE